MALVTVKEEAKLLQRLLIDAGNFDVLLVEPGPAELCKVHDQPQVNVCFERTDAQWSINGGPVRERSVAADTFVYYPPGIEHFVRAVNTQPRIAFELKKGAAEAVWGDQVPTTVSEFIDYRAHSDIVAIGRGAVRALARWKTPDAVALEGCALAAFGLAHNPEDLASLTLPSGRENWPALVDEYIRENLQNRTQIADLAAIAGLSAWSFGRAFKAAKHETVSAYIQRCRLELAYDLLTNTNLALSEIAYRAGFANQSHMGRLIKQTFKRTPRQVRLRE